MEIVATVVYLSQNYIGLLMPPVIDFVNGKLPGDRYKKCRFILAIMVSVLVGSLINLDKVIAGDWSDLLGMISFIALQGQMVYKLYWENSTPRVKMFGAGIISEPGVLQK
jgi:hypothetical protein